MKIKNLVHFSIGPVGAAVLGLITLPFIAWFFTVEDVGRLALLQVVLGLSSSLISLQLHQAYVREYHEQTDKLQLFNVIVVPSLLVYVLVALIGIIQPYSISEALFGIDSSNLTVYLFVAIFSSVVINLLAHVLRMQERGIAYSATQITPKLFLLILISVILIFKIPSEFSVLIIINTLALFTSLIVFLWLTRETWVKGIGQSVNIELLLRMLRFSLPLVLGGLAYWGLTSMDRFFLRAYSDLGELGVYALSVSLAASVSVVSSVFSNLWHPIVFKWVKDGVDPNKIHAVSEFMLLLVAIIWSMVGLLSWVLTYFLPENYSAIEYLIVACVAMPLFYMLSETTVVGIGIARKSSFSMLASLIAFLINAISNFLFIPEYGSSGAALSSVIAFFVFFLIRTEASFILWEPLPRIKIYIAVVMYICMTFIMVLTKNEIEYFFLVWVGLLLFVSVLFWVRVNQVFLYIKNILSKI